MYRFCFFLEKRPKLEVLGFYSLRGRRSPISKRKCQNGDKKWTFMWRPKVQLSSNMLHCPERRHSYNNTGNWIWTSTQLRSLLILLVFWSIYFKTAECDEKFAANGLNVSHTGLAIKPNRLERVTRSWQSFLKKRKENTFLSAIFLFSIGGWEWFCKHSYLASAPLSQKGKLHSLSHCDSAGQVSQWSQK